MIDKTVMKLPLILLCTFVIFGGCMTQAPNVDPGFVAPTYVPESVYNGFTEEQAYAEQSRLIAELSKFAQAWPVSMPTGDYIPKVASLKGCLGALHRYALAHWPAFKMAYDPSAQYRNGKARLAE